MTISIVFFLMCFDIGFVTAGPNEALIISGIGHGTQPKIIVGGRALVRPPKEGALMEHFL